MKTNIRRLDSVTHNDTAATKLINDNFEALQQGIEDALSRSGKTPNFMDAVLDMNMNRIINIADPVDDYDLANKHYVDTKVSGLQEQIDAEELRAKAAEAVLDGKIDAEIIRAELAEGVLDDKITAEENRAKGVEGDLSELTTTDKSDLVSAINEVDGDVASIEETVEGYGDIVTHDADEFATAAQGALADTALQPADLTGYATETWVGNQGYITGITSSDVTSALGYTPYDSSNPSGYTDNVGTVTSVNNTSPDSNGNVTISTGGNYTAGTGIDITDDVISIASPTLTNTATGSSSVTIEGTAGTGMQSVNIGVGSSTLRSSVAIGYSAQNTGTYNVCIGSYSGCSVILGYGVALGYGSHSNANYAIQIGYGTNSEANSFYVATSSSNNWKMLGSDGLIPAARLPIATSVSSSSTNDETLGAKLFYDTCGDIETLINAL